MYTVKQLSELTGVSVRTLHYYDEIELLTPSSVGENNYRYYNDDALFRLQQILFYRELGLALYKIKEILDNPAFNTLEALRFHRRALEEKIDRLRSLVRTVDATIMHLTGEVKMNEKKNIFEGFSAEQQKEYEAQAIEQWGDYAARSIQLWNSSSEERKAEILQEGSDIYTAIVAHMDKGPDSPEIRALIVRWHQHLRYFYEPTIEVLSGLGTMYHDHPDFNATFTKIHPALPAFLKKAIAGYVDGLETKWLEKELGMLEE